MARRTVYGLAIGVVITVVLLAALLRRAPDGVPTGDIGTPTPAAVGQASTERSPVPGSPSGPVSTVPAASITLTPPQAPATALGSASPVATKPASQPVSSATPATAKTPSAAVAPASPVRPDLTAVPSPGPKAMTVYAVTNPNNTDLDVQHVLTDASGFHYEFWSHVLANTTVEYHLRDIPAVPSPFTGDLKLSANQPFTARIVGYDYP